MRIAITGAHGVGKSTLALLLATELQLPLIEEIARATAEKMGYMNTREIVAANTIDRQRFQEAILTSPAGKSQPVRAGMKGTEIILAYSALMVK